MPLPFLVRIEQGKGGGAPLSFSLPISFPLLVGVLLLLGGGLLLARLSWPAGPPSLEPLYTEAGAPLETQVVPHDHIISRVWCPLPP